MKEDTISCYLCNVARYVSDGSIMAGNENCANNLAELKNSIVHLPREDSVTNNLFFKFGTFEL